MKIRRKAPNFALTKELNENTDKTEHQILVESLAGLGFGERIYDVNIEKYPIFHANNKQVIMRCCSYNYGLCLNQFRGCPPPRAFVGLLSFWRKKRCKCPTMGSK